MKGLRPFKFPLVNEKPREMGIKWWHWSLLGLGLVMLVGGLVYTSVTGWFGRKWVCRKINHRE